MDLPDTPFTHLDWDRVPVAEHPGTTGISHWRTFTSGELRVRMVDYHPGFLADHWCDIGHVLHVITGQLFVELADGAKVTLAAGSSFCVSTNGDAAHRVRTEEHCRVFIVD
jgi:hypothetical protein